MIPVGDFPLGKPQREAVIRVLDSGRVTEGKEMRAFEREWAAACGAQHGVACSSGWAALLLALRALKIQRGATRPLVLPGLTFVATASAALMAGWPIRFADVSSDTLCLTKETVAAAGGGECLPVHLMGFTSDVTGPVEDGCEAHLATFADGTRVGSRSKMTCFSFFVAHNIQAGELGCVTTDDAALATLMRRLRAQSRLCTCKRCTRSEGRCPQMGVEARFTSDHIAYNVKPNEFACALARSNLVDAECIIASRRGNYRLLHDALHSMAGMTVLHPQDGFSPLAFPLLLDEDRDRSAFITRLADAGVESRGMFPCIPTQQPAFARYKRSHEGHLPVSEAWGSRGVYVGVHQYLSRSDLSGIISGIKGALK